MDFYEEDLDDEEGSEDDDGEVILVGSMYERDCGVGRVVRFKGLRSEMFRGEVGGFDLGSLFLGILMLGIFGGFGFNNYF